jgi:hypothetical protein
MLIGCATVGERNEQSAAIRAILAIHKDEAIQYSMYGHFAAFPVRHVEGYEITTELTSTGYRVTARPRKREYSTMHSDETMKLQVVR